MNLFASCFEMCHMIHFHSHSAICLSLNTISIAPVFCDLEEKVLSFTVPGNDQSYEIFFFLESW